MSHGFAGGQQSPFSPSSSPNWSFQASHPSFGAQTGSPFRPASGAGLFQSSTSPLFPNASGAGGSLFPTQSSGSLFPQFQQSSGGLFPQPQPQQQQQSWSASSGGWWQPQQQQSGGMGWWNSQTAQQRQPRPPERNAFREEFYRALTRKDKRPVTVHTKVEELEESGQRALRMIHDEQEKYRQIREEILREPWFRPETKMADLEEEFKEGLSNFRKTMKAHGLDVDSFARELQRIRPRAKMMDEALRDADHIVSEMDKLVKPANGQGQHLYSSELHYQRDFAIPHPFTVRRAKELESRLKNVMERVTDLEKNKTRSQSESSQEDPLAAFEFVHKLSGKVANAIDKTSQRVEMKKEYYLTNARFRQGVVVGDPFEEAAKEQRIRESEVYYDLHQKRTAVMQPQLAGGDGAGAPQNTTPGSLFPSAPASTPLLTFGPSTTSVFNNPTIAPSSTSLFGPSLGAASGGLFGNTGWGSSSSGPLFGSGAASQPASTLFGQPASGFQSSGGLFGSTPVQSSGGFGPFGAASSGGVSPQPQFGRAGFGSAGTNSGGSFSSLGLFGAKNTGNRSL